MMRGSHSIIALVDQNQPVKSAIHISERIPKIIDQGAYDLTDVKIINKKMYKVMYVCNETI